MKRWLLLLVALVSMPAVEGQTRYEVTHLPMGINTTGSETGAVMVGDSVLLYTSMQNQDANHLYLIDFTPVLTRVMQTTVSSDGSLGEGALNLWGLNANGMNCGNVTYDAKNDIIYFTRGEFGKENVNKK